MTRRIIVFCLCCLFACSAFAKRRDPLTPKEVDEMRDAAQDGAERLKLLTKFARARMLAIEQIRGDSKLADRPKQVHDLLDDFAEIVDEMDRNLDMYQRERSDLRKGLKLEIEALTDFQLKLRAIKQTSSEDDLREYGFVLDSAVEAVNSNLDSARESLDQQNQQAEAAKKDKKKH